MLLRHLKFLENVYIYKETNHVGCQTVAIIHKSFQYVIFENKPRLDQ